MKVQQYLPLLLAGYPAAAQDILDIAEGDDRFGTLVAALDESGLAYVFDESWVCSTRWWSPHWCPEYTVFAPTNDAFDALPSVTLDRLLDEEFHPHLKDLLLYHTVYGEIKSPDISDKPEVKTLNGEVILANVGVDGGVTLNTETNVIQADVDASNGVVHVIDKVLLPGSMSNIAEVATAAGFSTLVLLLNTLGVDLGAFITDPENVLTVFAPTNEAFQELIDSGFDTTDTDAVADLLKYHVIQGEVVTSFELHKHPRSIETVQGSSIKVESVGWWGWDSSIKLNGEVGIAKADVLASNGIIHVIDSVLTPSELPGDITTVASGNPDFSTLVDALTKAELVETLQGEGPFTVFAPTNDAFEKAGIDVETATKEELAPILLYHVLAGSKLLKEQINSSVIQTNPISPTNLLVDVWKGWSWSSWSYISSIYLNNDVKVTSADVLASNGVIHVIDDVLIPPKNIVEVAIDNSDTFSTLVSLLSTEGVDLVPTLSGDGPFTVFAPTNDAFAQLGDAGLTTEQLRNVLLYHVIPGNVLYKDLEEGDIDTAFVKNGVTQTFNVNKWRSWSKPSIKGDENSNPSKIVKPDILVGNGIIHAINMVLLPNLE